MKRLCLLRHAKAEQAGASGDDAARGLTSKGDAVADFLSDFMLKQGYRPGMVLCSTARRAVGTLAPLAQKCPDLRILYRDQLYMAMPGRLLEEIHQAPDDTDTLLVVAHNPGLSLLAASLPGKADEAQGRELENGLPTGGFAVFLFDVDRWDDVKPGTAKILFFGKPRDMMAKR